MTQDLGTLVEDRFERGIAVAETFFATESGHIAEACLAMARRFHRGGRLLAFGNGAWSTDAQHVAVEFVHPVIVGKRALPALALTNDNAMLSILHDSAVVRDSTTNLRVLAARPISRWASHGDGACSNVVEGLTEARPPGLLTLGLAGGDGGAFAHAELDFCFVVPRATTR